MSARGCDYGADTGESSRCRRRASNRYRKDVQELHGAESRVSARCRARGRKRQDELSVEAQRLLVVPADTLERLERDGDRRRRASQRVAPTPEPNDFGLTQHEHAFSDDDFAPQESGSMPRPMTRRRCNSRLLHPSWTIGSAGRTWGLLARSSNTRRPPTSRHKANKRATPIPHFRLLRRTTHRRTQPVRYFA